MIAHTPKYNENGSIDLIWNHPELGEIPFTASLTDTDYAADLFNRALAGEFGVVEPYVAPVIPHTVPQKVTRFQARAALFQAGLLNDVETYMADPNTDGFTKIAWADAQEFNRTSPLVESIGQLIGLTPLQLDDLFVFASTISA